MNHPYLLKRLLPFLLGLSAISNIQAATYYVSVISGSDSNNGSINTPFQHIQQAANVMVAGDVCNVRAGLYRETVTVKASNITFQAYNPTPATPATADRSPSQGRN